MTVLPGRVGAMAIPRPAIRLGDDRGLGLGDGQVFGWDGLGKNQPYGAPLEEVPWE